MARRINDENSTSKNPSNFKTSTICNSKSNVVISAEYERTNIRQSHNSKRRHKATSLKKLQNHEIK